MYRFDIENNPKITALHTAFRRDFSPDYKFHGESHNFYELVSIIEGKVSITADSNVFSLKKGQAILHPPMQFHNICNLDRSNTTIIVFTFSGENIPDLCNKIYDLRDISKVKSLYERFEMYFTRDGMWVTGLKEQSLEHFKFIKEFELFLTAMMNNSSEGKTRLTPGAVNYSLIVKNMEDHVCERLTVKKLASLCSMSEINLQKTFSKYAGVSVMEYFKRIQMEKACELLKDGQSVKETALELGYGDQNYFSTVFKRITGHTPSEMRK